MNAAVTRMNQALIDSPERIEEVADNFGIKLDPRYPENLREFLADSARLDRLWNKRVEVGWEWLRSTLFSSYEADVEPKLTALQPILDYLERLGIGVTPYATFDLATQDVAGADIVFLDFFLKNEQHPDESFKRADRLSAFLEEVRDNERRRYPLIVLFSSRSGAEALASEFKERSSLRGCFFHFLSKSRTDSDDLEVCLSRLLPDYSRNQRLAKLLDAYGQAALRAATTVRKQVLRLEPTDVALLHAAALIAEDERFPHYLEWLTGVYLSTAFCADKQLKALSQEIVEIGSKIALPGHIPADRTLSKLFIATTARNDLADGEEYSMQYKLGLGDIFVEGQPEAVLQDAARLLVVIDQSCDLTRADSAKERVLCLRALNCIEIQDMALAIYESDNWPTYFLEFRVGDRPRLFRVTWNLVDAETVARRLLDERTGFMRIARLQEVIALQLQERFLQNVGRIGTAVQPPLVGAYSARLRLGRGRTILDTQSEPWAAVTVVSGRAPKQKKEQQQDTAGPQVHGAGQPKARKHKSGSDSEPLLDLFFCGEFVDWLKKNLPTAFGEDVGLRGAVTTFREILKQEGGPRGNLGLPKENGARKLTLGDKPAQIKLEVVETNEHLEASTENVVLQLVEHSSISRSGDSQ